MGDQLLPCPFCGSNPEQYDNEYACCTGPKCPMSNLVIDNRVWNTRAQPAASEPKPVDECAHSYANKLGCPECGEEFTHPAPANDEHSQFLADVMTAAGLLSCGKRDKALAERLSKQCMAIRLGKPAPDGVVLPERKSSLDVFTTYGLGECAGWNACLDEVARLNAVKPC